MLSTLNSIKSYISAKLNIDTKLDNRFGQSVEKVSMVSPDEDNILVIDPNTASLFYVSLTTDANIEFNAVNDVYPITGSTITILLERSNSNIIVTWPNNITWKGNVAPTLSHRNLITLTTFDGELMWYGGSIVIDDTYPVSSS